jgi:hypothetical protein
MSCKHRHLTYKIYRLVADDEYEDKLLFIKRCKKCNRLTIKLVYTREDKSKWQKVFVEAKAEAELERLQRYIIGVYKTPNLKFLDIGWVYLDGRAGAMKKMHNGAVVTREINGNPSNHLTIDNEDEHTEITYF